VSFTSPQVFEAEDAELSGGPVAAIGGTNTSGGGYVDMIGKEGSLTWLIEVTAAGQYKLTWKYAQLEERDMELQVNCVQTHASVQFGYTGSWGDLWKSDISRTVALKAGTNRLVLATNGGSGPNFDTITIEKL